MLFMVILVTVARVGGYELTILHTNDVHARFEQTNKYSATCLEEDALADNCYGGVARRYTAVNAIRQDRENVILLDAGDQFQGTLWFSEYKGLATSHFMNLLQYDAMVLGNHEFDLGTEGLEPFLRNVTFPVLSSNIDASNDSFISGLFSPSTVLDVGGQQIGVIGYTIAETQFLVERGGIRNLVFEDEITAVQREVNKLTDEGVNKIIVLGHGGYVMDMRIAEEVTGVDIVVGGHSNTFLFNGEADDYPRSDDIAGPYPTVIQNANGSQVLVVQAYAYGKYLGFLTAVFDDDGFITSWSRMNPINLGSMVEPDRGVEEEIREWAEPLQAIRQMVIGETYVLLDGPSNCRLRECNLGNVICDALLEEHITGPSKPGDPWTDVSLVMLNGGGFRVSTEQGMITMENILDTLPFRNTVVMVTITGQIIHEALEHSASVYNPLDPKGAFLQFSGFRVVYDITQPVGHRVASVSVRCQNCTIPKFQPLEKDKHYNVLINSFMLSGGDGYSMIENNIIDVRDFGNLMSDSVANYVRRHSPIYKGKEGRIYVIHGVVATFPPPSTQNPMSTRLDDVSRHDVRTTTLSVDPPTDSASTSSGLNIVVVLILSLSYFFT